MEEEKMSKLIYLDNVLVFDLLSYTFTITVFKPIFIDLY